MRVERRCPRLAQGEDGEIQRHLQRVQGLSPDPSHPDACARLGADALAPHVGAWIADYGAWSHGVLRVRGALADQPAPWLDAMRAIDGAVADWHAEQRREIEAARATKGSAGPAAAGETAESAGYPPLRPPYGKRG